MDVLTIPQPMDLNQMISQFIEGTDVGTTGEGKGGLGAGGGETWGSNPKRYLLPGDVCDVCGDRASGN